MLSRGPDINIFCSFSNIFFLTIYLFLRCPFSATVVWSQYRDISNDCISYIFIPPAHHFHQHIFPSKCVWYTGGNRAKLPSSRWRRRGRSLREVFASSRLFATTDLSQICNRVTRGHGTPCTKTTDSYPFSFLYNNLRKIRRETTVGEKPGRR